MRLVSCSFCSERQQQWPPTLKIARPRPQSVLGTRNCIPAAQTADSADLYLGQWIPAARSAPQLILPSSTYPHRDSTLPPRGTLVGTEGGPGFSTTRARKSYLALFAPLLRRWDLLLVDNRGTGRSGPISCEPLQSMAGQTVAAVGTCGRSLGDAAALYGTGIAADDLAAILDALGIPKIDLYGDSYGTFFGQTFAARHPDRLRSLVLDGAYPVIGEDPFFGFGPAAARRNLDVVCQRSASCRDVPGTSLARVTELVNFLRMHPIRGDAHTIGGSLVPVLANPAAVGNVLFDSASGGLNERELDPAARALLNAKDPAPLLRLIAENNWLQGDGRSGEPPSAFSRGLNAAVSCMDYPQLYSMTAGSDQRRAEFAAKIAAKEAVDFGVYAPLTIAEWLQLPVDLSLLNLCLEWPLPAPRYAPGHPVPLEVHFPSIPTLVLSGELDEMTTPEEGALVARQFPRATHVIVANSFHVVALGDVNGCASRITQHFVENLEPGDLSCAARIGPLRMPPAFPAHASDLPPAVAQPGNTALPDGLALAATAIQTAADVLARWQLSYGEPGAGLRGGSFRPGWVGENPGIRLDQVQWTEDLAVSGLIIWNWESVAATGHLELFGPGSHRGTLDVNWSGRGGDARAFLNGTIDGRTVVAIAESPSTVAGESRGR